MNDNKVLLVDAYAQIYRGFFAVRHLSDSKGRPSNAVFALARFLINMHKDYGNTKKGAFVFDLGKPQFRIKLAPEYKANRPPMPDEMKSQLPFLRELISAFGWPIIEKEGFEADDLIASLCKNFPDSEFFIISRDKDLAQLVDERVNMLMPASKGGGLDKTGVQEITDKFGVKPEQIIDYLSLIGDSSDNIPGVPSVGPKTAAKLLSEFDNIDNLLANTDKIRSEKLREKIIQSPDVLKKNIELITLKSEIEDENLKNPESLKMRAPDWQKIREICSGLDLNSIIKELPDSTETTVKPQASEDKNESSMIQSDLFSSAPSLEKQNSQKDDTPDLFD